MPDDTPTLNKKKRKDTSLGIKSEIKERLENLDFVKKHSFSEILEILMDFYEVHKTEFKKWNEKKKKKL